jgi:hypothetical protein
VGPKATALNRRFPSPEVVATALIKLVRDVALVSQVGQPLNLGIEDGGDFMICHPLCPRSLVRFAVVVLMYLDKDCHWFNDGI